MDITHLKEFVVLAQTGNFMEAAGILFISQSSLSKHIKSLEGQLGVQLFNRTTRSVELSEQGALLLPYANGILQLQNEYKTALVRGGKLPRQSIAIGSIPAMAQYNITDLLASFKKKHPDCALDITQGGTDKLKELLRAGRLELAFVREVGPVEDDLARLPYAEDSLVAVIPATHPLAGRKNIPLAALKDEELLMLDENTMLYTLSVEACRQSGFEPKVAYTDHMLENIVDLVTKGMGVALLMKRLAVYLANPKVVVVELTPKVHTQLSLCRLKGKKLSPAAKAFYKEVLPMNKQSGRQ